MAEASSQANQGIQPNRAEDKSKMKALIVVTSATPAFWPGGIQTGYFFTEVLHPYVTFKNHGYDVDIASETGKTGIDKSSVPYAQLDGESRRAYNDPNHEIHHKLGDGLKKSSDLKGSDYEIIFFAGGHGAAFDFPTATHSQNLASEIYDNNGVVAAVCHGPAIFAGIKDKKAGDLLIKGRKATGFSTRGEYAVGAVSALKQHGVKLIEDFIKEAGGIWQEPHDEVVLPTTPFIVVDGRIVTGVNPMSAGPMAQKSVEIVKGHEVENKMAKQSVF